jgi:signal transduction histidine kinase
MQRGALALVIAALAIAFGLYALGVARGDPAYWFGGASALTGTALLAAGWALTAAGLTHWIRRPESLFGPLLATAGFAWFVPELDNPEVGAAIAFTVGLVLPFLCPALVGHALLLHPGSRLRGPLERTVAVLGYSALVGVLGLLPALLTDPQATGCSACPENLLAVSDRGSAAQTVTRIGLVAGASWGLAVAGLCLHRLRSARGLRRPLLAAGVVYAGLVAAQLALSVEPGLVEVGAPGRRLWLGQAAALVALAGIVGWSWIRARHARDVVARLVLELAESPPPGGLRDALARIVGDPELVLAYPLGDDGRLVDAAGAPVELGAERHRTQLVREGRPVAVLAHADGLLSDEQVVDEVAAAARLALENERLQAEIQARLSELRASRARIVATGDAERRRLERDLHDGAQQRLVGLALSLRMLRSQLDTPQLARADEELRLATADLRELAHGIFPAVLADEGLAAAVEALGEEARVPVRIGALAEGRFGDSVETAAYTVIAEIVRSADSPVDVATVRTGSSLEVDVVAEVDGIDLVGLEDRIGALEGTLAVERSADRVHVHAELPCAS